MSGHTVAPPGYTVPMLRTLVLLALAGLACGEAKDQAKEKAQQARVAAADVVGTVKTAGSDAFDAAAVALRAKRELDKVYRTTSGYDLVVAAQDADDAGLRAHAAKIEAMPHVTVKGVTVGYQEDRDRSLRGESYARHFRATFVLKGRTVGVSYYTHEELDLIAFAALLERLVPVVLTAME